MNQIELKYSAHKFKIFTFFNHIFSEKSLFKTLFLSNNDRQIGAILCPTINYIVLLYNFNVQVVDFLQIKIQFYKEFNALKIEWRSKTSTLKVRDLKAH